MWTAETRVRVLVKGNAVEVNSTDPFKETVTRLAKEHGLREFSVFVDGEEIVNPALAPADFSGVQRNVEIRAYQLAG